MNARTLLLPLIGIVTGLLVSSAYARGPNGPGGQGGGGGGGGQVVPLSAEEAQHVVYMREEEKLARDVYLTLFDVWNLPVFSNIASSEQRHMNALGRLIVRYDLEDPIVDDTVGVFSNPVFVELYAQLVASGSESEVAALRVGALIEELDIVDLREALAVTDHADLEWVFENLMRGTRNHLRAFAQLLAAAGETYEAQHLTQEEFDEIANSPWERGNGRRNGQGHGRCGGGQGGGQGSGAAGCLRGPRARFAR